MIVWYLYVHRVPFGIVIPLSQHCPNPLLFLREVLNPYFLLVPVSAICGATIMIFTIIFLQEGNDQEKAQSE